MQNKGFGFANLFAGTRYLHLLIRGKVRSKSTGRLGTRRRLVNHIDKKGLTV